ncbi:MAG: hypothetical protein JO362_18120 [Streptomycetaceae bacterium]|nr:hypothetical protein [Streptomycetaceae bacterium]
MAEIVEKIVKPTVEILGHISEKIPRALAAAHDRIGTMARDAATHFEKVEEDIADRVPVYMVDHEGKVMKVGENELTEVALHDTSGIRNILDDENKTLGKKPGEYLLGPKSPGKEWPMVNSEEVAPGTTELSRATQQARGAMGDEGANNYAAFHYKGKDGEFILVGRSKSYGSHSEQYAGVPFLANKENGNLTGDVVAAYSERAPCQRRSPKCAAWLAKYFPGTDVSHSFIYGPEKEDETVGNEAHASYLKDLFK